MSVKLYVMQSVSIETADLLFHKTGEAKGTKSKFVKGVDLKDIDEAKTLLVNKFKTNDVEIHLIDVEYMIKFFYTKEGKDYYRHLNQIKDKVIFHTIMWESYVKTIQFNDEDIHIFATKENFNNVYKFANTIDMKLAPNKFFITGIKTLSDCVNCYCPLNIFSTNNQKDVLSVNEEQQHVNINSIKEMLMEGLEQLELLIIAGCFDGEFFIQKKVPSWVFNVESFFMKGVILEHNMLPRVLDFGKYDNSHGKTLQELFTESAEYRKDITHKIAEVLYSYGKNYISGFFIATKMEDLRNTIWLRNGLL